MDYLKKCDAYIADIYHFSRKNPTSDFLIYLLKGFQPFLKKSVSLPGYYETIKALIQPLKSCIDSKNEKVSKLGFEIMGQLLISSGSNAPWYDELMSKLVSMLETNGRFPPKLSSAYLLLRKLIRLKISCRMFYHVCVAIPFMSEGTMISAYCLLRRAIEVSPLEQILPDVCRLRYTLEMGLCEGYLPLAKSAGAAYVAFNRVFVRHWFPNDKVDYSPKELIIRGEVFGWKLRGVKQRDSEIYPSSFLDSSRLPKNVTLFRNGSRETFELKDQTIGARKLSNNTIPFDNPCVSRLRSHSKIMNSLSSIPSTIDISPSPCMESHIQAKQEMSLPKPTKRSFDSSDQDHSIKKHKKR